MIELSITAIIDADPTDIAITRHEKIPSAGGFAWVEVPIPAQRVRLYHISPRNQSEFTLPEGEVKRIVAGLLAGTDADFAFDHESYDTFEHDDRTYRIVGVRHYALADCTQCDLVVV